MLSLYANKDVPLSQAIFPRPSDSSSGTLLFLPPHLQASQASSQGISRSTRTLAAVLLETFMEVRVAQGRFLMSQIPAGYHFLTHVLNIAALPRIASTIVSRNSRACIAGSRRISELVNERSCLQNLVVNGFNSYQYRRASLKDSLGSA